MFTWDEAKRQANLAKHGVDFTEAERFDFDQAVSAKDNRHDYGEDRLVAIAPIGDRLHVMTYTERGSTIRIINLRKANRREMLRWLNTKSG